MPDGAIDFFLLNVPAWLPWGREGKGRESKVKGNSRCSSYSHILGVWGMGGSGSLNPSPPEKSLLPPDSLETGLLFPHCRDLGNGEGVWIMFVNGRGVKWRDGKWYKVVF